MPLLGNSGFLLPESLEKLTRQAGKQAFAGVADLWLLLSDVEGGGEFRTNPRELKERSVERLAEAASIYRDVAKEIGGLEVRGLTRSERRLAGLNYEEFPPFQHINLPEAYRELATRLESLGSQIRTFDVSGLKPGDEAKHAYDLAPLGFRMMQHWEEAATLGRAIAVLNRRRSEP
jgi:hypothetical protein